MKTSLTSQKYFSYFMISLGIFREVGYYGKFIPCGLNWFTVMDGEKYNKLTRQDVRLQVILRMLSCVEILCTHTY